MHHPAVPMIRKTFLPLRARKLTHGPWARNTTPTTSTAAMYAETRNMTPYGESDFSIADKTQNFEVTAQYQFDFGLRPEVSYLQSKGKDLAGRTAHGARFDGGDADWSNMFLLVPLTTSTKTCPPMLITKSTCWIKMNSPKLTRSLPITSLALAWCTSSKLSRLTAVYRRLS